MNLCISSRLAVVWLTSRIPNQIKRNGYIDFIFTARSSLFIIFIVTIYVYFWLSPKCPYSIERPVSDSKKSLSNVPDDLRFAKINGARFSAMFTL